jgi:AraC-like DNA-binding protein
MKDVPRIVRTPKVSAVYLPRHCDTPAEALQPGMQVMVSSEEQPLVSVASPNRAAPLAKSVEDRVVLTLDPDMLGGIATEIGVQETCDPYLYGIVHSIRCGFRHGSAPPEPYLETVADSIAAHLREHYPVRSRKRERQGLSPARLARVLLLVEERMGGSLAVEELAQAVHLSPFHFTRMFRRSTGLSPHAFITMRRLEKAKHLLSTTDRTMGHIATVVGYKNQAHFTRVFHANVGMTPRRFRALSRTPERIQFTEVAEAAE